MNPVVGLDVAKGESQLQMFLDKKMPYKSSVKIEHTVEGLEELHSYLLDLERQTGLKPSVVLESTGHYHAPVVQFLEAREYIVIIVNPLVSYRAKSSSLRKTKTDAIDAYHLDSEKAWYSAFKPSVSDKATRKYDRNYGSNKATISSCIRSRFP